MHVYVLCRFLDLVNFAIRNSLVGGENKLASLTSVDGEDNFKIDYEYEMNESGERVVLGKGSFGTVYSGVDMVTRKKMAIKEISSVESSDTG